MERQIDGKDTGDYLWSEKGVVPFLKVDKGLADDADGVQVMKPIADLDDLLARANAKDMFGTKMRSVIKLADEAGVDAVVDQQFEVGGRILDAGLVPIIEPEVDIHSPQKAEAETLLKAAIRDHLDDLPDGPAGHAQAHAPIRGRLLQRPRRPPEGAASRRPFGRLLPGRGERAPGPQPRGDRQLLPGADRGVVSAQQSDAEFDATLDATIKGDLRGVDHLMPGAGRHDR